MSLGIVTALPEELATLTRARAPREGTWAGEDGVIIVLPEDVLIVLSGVGPQRAAWAGNELVMRGADALLSWGTATALDPALPPGSLVLPERVIGGDGVSYPVDAPWRRRLAEGLSRGLDVHGGALVESREILRGREDKSRLRQTTQAGAADMESAALARLAQARGLPFCAIRAIVDPAELSMPPCVLRALDECGRVRKPALLAQAITHPGQWLGLARLARQFSAARKTLRRVMGLTGFAALGPNSRTGEPCASGESLERRRP
jgi:adenosylhomocysteine nucleosidase